MSENKRKLLLEKLKRKPCGDGERLFCLLNNAFGEELSLRLAKKLLTCFPSTDAVLSAGYEELCCVPDMTEEAASYLRAVGLAAERDNDDGDIIIKTPAELAAVALSRLGREDCEVSEFYLTDERGKVTHIETYSTGDAEKVILSAEQIMGLIVIYKPKNIGIAHNHVRAKCTPSAADDNLTRAVISACELCGVKFLDHCIVNDGGEYFSYVLSNRFKK